MLLNVKEGTWKKGERRERREEGRPQSLMESRTTSHYEPPSSGHTRVTHCRNSPEGQWSQSEGFRKVP